MLSALMLLASACGGGAGTEATDASGATTQSSAPTSADDQVAVAEAAAGPDLGLLGQGSLEGQDVVVWFWAEW